VVEPVAVCAATERAEPAVPRFLAQVARFLRTARRALETTDLTEVTLIGFAKRERYSPTFLDHYLVPLAAALRSSEPAWWLVSHALLRPA
jgi:predicted NAD/FAD-binding protein